MARWRLALRSVLQAPAVIERDLSSLLSPPAPSEPSTAASDAEQAVRLSHRMLAALGRLRRFSVDRWRVTCLYRSVSECLVLRDLGFPARVLIGARVDDTSGSIAAHAWVECEGVRCASTKGDAEYAILSPASAAKALH